MIDVTLNYLAKALDDKLQNSFDFQGPGVVVGVPGTKNDQEVEEPDALVITLLQVSREASVPYGVPQVERQGGTALHRKPPLVLNLDILLAARFPGRYDQGLAALSEALAFFQATPYFQRESHPDLPKGLDRLGLDLSSMGMHDLTGLWSVMGGQFLPSVVYRLRLVTIDGGAPPVESRVVEEVTVDVQRRPDRRE